MNKNWFALSALLMCVALLAGCSPPPPVSLPETGTLQVMPAGQVHQLTAEVPNVGDVVYSLSISETYDPSVPAPLLLLLHYGYEGARPDASTGSDMIGAFSQAVGDFGGVTIAPVVTGGDWTTASNEIAAVWLVKSAMETYNIDPSRVVIAGYSMGGAGTWFIGSRHQDLFTAAVPIAAPVVQHDEWKLPARVIHSDNDQLISHSSAKSHAEGLKEAGADVAFVTASGLDHYDAGSYSPYLNQALQAVTAK